MLHPEKTHGRILMDGRAAHDLYHDALNALSDRVAILDAHGVVVWVNRAWRVFAARPEAPAFAQANPGDNYFEACRRAANAHPVAQDTLYGIYSVLEGMLDRFSIEYGLQLAGSPSWWQAVASPMNSESGGLLLTHHEITAQKLAEQERNRLNLDVARAGQSLQELSALLPLCGACGRRRDDPLYLQQLESYVHDHPLGAGSFCPDCREQLAARRFQGPGPVQQDLFDD